MSRVDFARFNTVYLNTLCWNGLTNFLTSAHCCVETRVYPVSKCRRSLPHRRHTRSSILCICKSGKPYSNGIPITLLASAKKIHKQMGQEVFSGWITSDGEKQVKRLNSFVDWLEGKDVTVSKMLPRRWITYSSTRDHVDGKLKKYGYYTS